MNLARMAVSPYCASCGHPAVFARQPEYLDDLVPVRCACGWEGVSRVTVPQPEVPNTRLRGCGEAVFIDAPVTVKWE